MSIIKYNERIGRAIRSEGLNELGRHTYELVAEAIKDGRREEALELLDYMVFEILPGNTLSDVLKRFDYLTQVEEWCKKALQEWKFNAGVSKEYAVYFHSMKVAHYYWHPKTSSQIDEHWNDDRSLTISGRSRGLAL